jgi:8-oxo-dGTP pyrophosphatase MutT (NUDIX family)
MTGSREKGLKDGKGRRARKEVSAGGVVFRKLPDQPPLFLLIRDSYGHWGFPKGHLERGESAAQAAARETTEETGLTGLSLRGSLGAIDWYFRLRGRLIHKYCHFYLFESEGGDPVPQLDEGITECRWYRFEEAVTQLGYENARGILRLAGTVTDRLLAEPGAPERR